MSKLNIKIA